MRNVKAKALRREARSINKIIHGVDSTSYIKKEHKPKKYIVEELNEQGQLIKVEKAYIPLPTVYLEKYCTRATYQELKRMS